MQIRPAKPHDLQAVYALLCTLSNHTLPETTFAEIYAHNLAQPMIRYLVAEENGVVCGFISLHMDQHLHHAALVGEIRELIVDEAWRGRGVGSELLRAACDEAREAGCVQLELCSGFPRTQAHVFYQRNGWKKDHYSFTYKWLQEET
ncbi:MAG: GNAT family N-acetyltransferase [Clostridia bacterium]|nr:GNAT family N-acetyltransferase [Clostridia bacterium]